MGHKLSFLGVITAGPMGHELDAPAPSPGRFERANNRQQLLTRRRPRLAFDCTDELSRAISGRVGIVLLPFRFCLFERPWVILRPSDTSFASCRRATVLLLRHPLLGVISVLAKLLGLKQQTTSPGQPPFRLV